MYIINLLINTILISKNDFKIPLFSPTIQNYYSAEDFSLKVQVGRIQGELTAVISHFFFFLSLFLGRRSLFVRRKVSGSRRSSLEISS